MVAKNALVQGNEIVVLGGSCEVPELCEDSGGSNLSGGLFGIVWPAKTRAFRVEHLV